MSQPVIQQDSAPILKTVKSRKPKTRFYVQTFFFFLVALITLNKALSEIGLSIPYISNGSLHAICPFGGVASLYKFATAGTFVQKIHESSFVLMVIAFLLAILFGPVICSWVCPFGTFQEWLAKIGRKLFGKRFNHFIPASVDNVLRYLRYVVLFLVLYLTFTTTKLIFQDVDPYFALFQFWSDEVALSAFIILGATILLSLIIDRPWCKYACPYGAVLGIFNLFRVFKIRRLPSSCSDCKLCDRNCPMNITVSSGQAVLNHQCISCLSCTSENSCPISDTVEFTTKGGK